MGMILGAIHQVACSLGVRLPNIEREGGVWGSAGDEVHNLHRVTYVNTTFWSPRQVFCPSCFLVIISVWLHCGRSWIVKDLRLQLARSYVNFGSRVGIRFIPFHLDDDDDIWPNFENPSASSLVIGGGRSTDAPPPSPLYPLLYLAFSKG